MIQQDPSKVKVQWLTISNSLIHPSIHPLQILYYTLLYYTILVDTFLQEVLPLAILILTLILIPTIRFTLLDINDTHTQ